MRENLDAIFNTFEAYIQGQNYFDIVYAPKIGYIKILVKDPEESGVEVLGSPEKMLSTLFREIIDDVVFSAGNPQGSVLSEHIAIESRRRITTILETMKEEYRVECLSFLDEYLEAYQKHSERRENNGT